MQAIRSWISIWLPLFNGSKDTTRYWVATRRPERDGGYKQFRIYGAEFSTPAPLFKLSCMNDIVTIKHPSLPDKFLVRVPDDYYHVMCQLAFDSLLHAISIRQAIIRKSLKHWMDKNYPNHFICRLQDVSMQESIVLSKKYDLPVLPGLYLLLTNEDTASNDQHLLELPLLITNS